MASIRQNPATHPLPDWRNFGVMLRIVLGANLILALAALPQAGSLAGWLAAYLGFATGSEPPLLLAFCLLALLRNALWRLSFWQGRFAVLVVAAGCAALQFLFWQWLGLLEESSWGLIRAMLSAVLLAGFLLHYLELRARAYSPALAEARLLALNARIRPHFLFNAINAVLSLIRAQPKQAESALETISDLFRAALRDTGAGQPLSEEIALCRQYLELEKLRLGDRLQVEWEIGSVPPDAIIPPLMLQPLVENAVYHGIEPVAEGGLIRIRCERQGDELCIEVSNPKCSIPRQEPGNQMALANIRERLTLYHDLEGRLEIEETDPLYRVRIILPCHSKNVRSPS